MRRHRDVCVLGGKLVSHLLFIDNVSCFMKATIRSFNAVQSIIHDLSSFTGMQVNVVKSILVFSRSVVDRDALLSILGFQESSLPLTYLGVLIAEWELKLPDCD